MFEKGSIDGVRGRLARIIDSAPGLAAAARRLRPGRGRGLARLKGSRAASVDVDRFMETEGAGHGWTRQEYGRYYATSVPVYSAIRVRSEALARPILVVYGPGPAGTRQPGPRDETSRVPVGADHPVQRLLDRVNP